MTGKAIRPFEHLNLRRNPFGELPPGVRGHVAVVDAERFVEWIGDDGRVLELLGESGRGKTTHLRAIERHLPEAEYVRVRRDAAAPDIPSDRLPLVDELQFLAEPRRADLFAKFPRLVVGTHETFAGSLRERGFDVRTVRVGERSVRHLEEILERRIEWACRESGPVPRIAGEVVEALRDRHGSDIRAIEHRLYEVFQRLERPRTVGISDLDAAPEPAQPNSRSTPC